jgi:UDP-N-acetylglucosamine 2-epimerase
MRKCIKLVHIVGARPQFIKLSALVKKIKEYNLGSKCKFYQKIIHTGQHYDYEMSEIFFKELEIPKPDYNLEVGSYSHGKQTGLMLERIEEVLLKEKPNIVIVYGDTNSTLAGALAAVKLKIPVAHVEAGLRSFRIDMPEEINRVLTDHISSLLFCPTETAVSNLKREGITKNVYLVGDVMYEVLRDAIKISEKKSRILTKLNLTPKSYYLATIHRAENTDNFENLKNIFLALKEISKLKKVIIPLHPRTRKKISSKHFSFISNCSSLVIIDPVSYLDMIMLEKNAEKILTDSGGVQKESFWLGVPCITLRNETEWVETLKFKLNVLVGTDTKKIIDEVQKPIFYIRKIKFKNRTSCRIFKIIRKFLGLE